ncbi:MAG TPA: HD domain-containing phosphohydrolase, partial [Candidatus Dormibacteraeota bacterium]
MSARSGPPASIVLLVDDNQERARASTRALETAGYRVVPATDGAAGLRLLSAHDCSVVVCETLLPDMDGLDLCRAIKQAPATREIPVVLLLDRDDEMLRNKARAAGADDVCPPRVEPATIVVAIRAQLQIRQLRSQLYELEGVVLTLARAVEDRDHRSSGLSEKVAHWALELGRAAGLSRDEQTPLYKAALLHDVGSVAVPVEVLSKQARLDPQEFNTVKRHPIVGEEIVRALPGSDRLLPAVRHHHERIDGGGYPDGVAGESIPLFARIIAIADAFVAMTSDRPYRPRRSRDDAISRLRQGAGKQWDARLVELFIGVIGEAENREARAG